MVRVDGGNGNLIRRNNGFWVSVFSAYKLNLPEERLPWFATAPVRTILGSFVSILGTVMMVEVIWIENEIVVKLPFIESIVACGLHYLGNGFDSYVVGFPVLHDVVPPHGE